jgi:serine/threonine protein kinase
MATEDRESKSSTLPDLREHKDWVIDGKYKVFAKEMLGSGSFGEIYRGVNLLTHEEVAVKCEKSTILYPQLALESKLYDFMRLESNSATCHYYGSANGYNCLVMDLLGPSLEDLFVRCSRRFCLKTVLQLAIQLTSRIQSLHHIHFVHRDIKPDNFVVGKGSNESTVFMIDLGLAKRYRDGRTKVHVPFRDKKGITGTVRYVSINTHKGVEQTRRDDMESMGYMLIYFMNGVLPWQGVHAPTRKLKYLRIGDAKMNTALEDLCRYLPEEFITYLSYVRCLRSS